MARKILKFARNYGETKIIIVNDVNCKYDLLIADNKLFDNF